MADLTITVAQVQPGATGQETIEQGTAGAAITQGDYCYKDPADSNTWKPAQSDGTADEAGEEDRGIALNSAEDGQPVSIQKGAAGEATLGADAAMTVGTVYYLSNTAGGICPYADLASASRIVIVGIAKTAAILQMINRFTGIAKP